MRKADIRVDAEYAVRVAEWSDHATRVRVLSVGPGASADVKIVDPAPAVFERSWQRGARVTVSTRRITCSWSDWEAAAADRDARQVAATAREDELRCAKEPDPNRMVPDAYDGERVYRDGYHHELEVAVRGDRSWPVRIVVDALGFLPIAVQRDVVASATMHDLGKDSMIEGSRTVSDVFAPSVSLAVRPDIAMAPHLVLADHDAAFLNACQTAIADAGGMLELPFVPRLRLVDRYGRSFTVERPPLGWVRVAFGWTSGRKLHEPSCHVLRSNRERPDAAATMPLWRREVHELCGSCGGPGIVPDAAWVAFRAASDTWQARQPEPLEDWQVNALLHLLASTADARALAGEPDRTREAVVLDSLADDMPGEDGWPAYRLTHRYVPEQERPVGAERLAASKLACRRLRQLSEVLPPGQRPPVPFPLDNAAPDGAVPGPAEAVEEALQDWRDALDRAADIAELHLTMFGLPGAMHSW